MTKTSLSFISVLLHEHFELRPLLQDADDRLSKYQGTVAPEAILKARSSNLREAAHRVIQRQIAQLCEDDNVAKCTPPPAWRPPSRS